jgi:ribonucleotide reductase alpha subunit
MSKQTYTKEEVYAASLEYFNGDEFATDNFVKKYALKNENGEFVEKTPADMFARVAREIARIEKKYPEPVSYENIYDRISKWIIVPQGSPLSAIGNKYQIQSLSNCFVVDSPSDTYGGIMRADEHLAQIMKRRGGVGVDISNIRPQGMFTSNAARTTAGIGVFMERYSNTCREVGQDGRRGALMITISCHHPEIMTFINIKRNREKVTGANVSIRCTDEFMKAVVADELYEQRWPVDSADPKIKNFVRAREVWDAIIDAAHQSAEPGVLFWDTIIKNSPADLYADHGYRTISTNPCITGDTLIAVADGRNAVTIKQLADEGRDVPVYSTNTATGKVEIKFGRNPRLTKRNAEIWCLELDDGTKFTATPDHKILLRDLRYVELKDLKEGDSIFPFYSFMNNGYRQIAMSGQKMTNGHRRNRRQYRLIHEFYSGEVVDSAAYAIHHSDCCSTNDAYDNLCVMTHEEHRKLHTENMLGSKNPYHKMSQEWKTKFAVHLGDKNGRYSGFTNEQLLEHGKKLFKKNGKITKKDWIEYAKEKELPQHLSNDFRFGTWENFANQVSDNHKVVSVKHCGYADVYNITVDDNHNYHVITSTQDEKYVTCSGICVKNCGEIPLSSYDACRLCVVNASKFVLNPFLPNATFDYDSFYEECGMMLRFLDDIIDLEIEAIRKIISKIENESDRSIKVADLEREIELWYKILEANINGRRCGCGLTGVGDAIAMMGYSYGKESVDFVESLYKTAALGCANMTTLLAEQRGAFPIYDYEREADHPYIARVFNENPDIKKRYEKYGRRNIAMMTTAPVGTISTMTMTTSGIEPAIYLSYKRRKKINATSEGTKPDFVDQNGDAWIEFDITHHGLKQWMNVTGNTDVTQSPYYGSTATEIDPIGSVLIQAAAQKWIDHSISKTCNLPQNVSKETVGELYIEAWRTGCKGFTIYREGSRTGVIVQSGQEANSDAGKIVDNHAPKRPELLDCDVHRQNIRVTLDDGTKQTQQWTVLIGLLEGRPYEIFCGLSENVILPKRYASCKIQKNKSKSSSRYDLIMDMDASGDPDKTIRIRNIVEHFNDPTGGAFTRVVSMSLRHGVPVQFIVEQLQRDDNGDMHSFSRALSRVLKKYIADGTKPSSMKKCEGCGSTELFYSQGCVSCKHCSWSKCG